jgi:hypothetical protein
MIEVQNTPYGGKLIIAGRHIRPGKNGDYKVSYKLLVGEDLTSVPPGTRITISYPGEEGRTLDSQFRLTSIEVLEQGRVSVGANHFRCACCWEHAMSHRKYTEAVVQLLQQEAAVSPSFSLEQLGVNKNGELIHSYAIDVANGQFHDIEAHMRVSIMGILKPLFDTRDAFDAQIFQQFGV